MKPLVYLAGPYSADPVANTRAATVAGQALWRTAGVAVVVPHWSLIGDAMAPMSREDWYRWDLDQLEHCDAVYRIPGESLGADREVERAGELGLPVFTTVNEVKAWAGEWQALVMDAEVDRLVTDLGRLRKDIASHRDEWDQRLDALATQNELLLSLLRKLAQAGGMRRGAWTGSQDQYIDYDEGVLVDITADEAAVWDALIKAAL